MYSKILLKYNYLQLKTRLYLSISQIENYLDLLVDFDFFILLLLPDLLLLLLLVMLVHLYPIGIANGSGVCCSSSSIRRCEPFPVASLSHVEGREIEFRASGFSPSDWSSSLEAALAERRNLGLESGV